MVMSGRGRRRKYKNLELGDMGSSAEAQLQVRVPDAMCTLLTCSFLRCVSLGIASSSFGAG
eukprot:960815-Rhodomonas_salina.1